MDIASFESFVNEIGTVRKAQSILDKAQIRVVNGYFDRRRLNEALAAPPSVTKHKFDWGISLAEGVGAMKYCVDKAGLRIVSHRYTNVNHLTLANRRNQQEFVKVYTQRKMHGPDKNLCHFTFTGFVAENTPRYYLMVCFEDPVAWVIDTDEVYETWKKIKSKRLKNPENMKIPNRKWDHEWGCLQMTFNSKSSEYVLDGPEKIGL